MKEETAAFAIGDVVRLKSGGPRMTVAELHETTSGVEVACYWFEAHGLGERLRRRRFHPLLLGKIDDHESF